jgi:hypothetical protein
MGTVHQLLLEFGKDKALKADIDRRVVEAAAGYLSAEENEIGFLYSGWAQAALPHRRLPDDAPWQVETDRVTLLVQPGMRPGKPPVSIGVPYGSRARLILLYLQSEALKTGSREVSLGRSLHAWLRRLGIPIGGRSMQDVRDQAERISRCRMSFQIVQGNRSGLVNQSILDTSHVRGGRQRPDERPVHRDRHAIADVLRPTKTPSGAYRRGRGAPDRQQFAGA